MEKPAAHSVSPNSQSFAVLGWTVCPLGVGNPGVYLWHQAYQMARQAAEEAVRRDLFRRQWWEPGLN